MKSEVINQVIATQLAIKLLGQDKGNFNEFRFKLVYQDLLDSIISQLQEEYSNLKHELIIEHHIDLKYIGNINKLERYTANGQVIEYTPSELKSLTRNVLHDYLQGDKLKKIKWKDRI